MKLFISVAILWSGALSASPIQVFYEAEVFRAEMIKEIFVREYQIPEDLITMKKVRRCDELRNRGKLDLCLKNNGDLLVVSVDRSFVNDSLKIFSAP